MKRLGPDKFPPLLREINDPPELLYMEGTLPDPSEYTYLTVVGSRRVTRYGAEACEKLIAGLAGYPVAIVSGLAIGTDTLAHKTAIRARLPTIAIPGSGLDRSVLHPPSNRRLADEIVEAGGALLSELEPKQPAGIHTFPRRNRIMAGLSKAVLLIEAGEQSGTLITARLAMEYNRDVLAVPGQITSPNSVGTNRLIRDGATPILETNDILEVLGIPADQGEPLGRGFKGSPSGGAKSDFAPVERQILDLLLEPISRDELIRAMGQPAHEVNALLMTLELKGAIRSCGGEVMRA